jgi:protein TonB
MFEDSTFESGGKIKTKSGRWMMVTGIVNGSILLLLILIPLIYPEALPREAMATLLIAPPPPPPPPPPPHPPEIIHVVHVQSEMMNNQLTAPTKIPHNIEMVSEKEAPPSSFGVAGSMGDGGSGVMGSIFGNGQAPKVKAAPPKKVNISAGVAVGMLLQKTQPIYPPIAKAARVSGTVVLQAMISKQGTIEDLKVVSGPAMLQGAALDAVRTWRYRPYLLNNDPVEVETTINVIFTLGG